jgi:ATP-dependent Clp protease ATP-binding subunit ClpA
VQALDNKLYRTALEVAKRKFSPEFMNRIDKVVVFRALTGDDLKQILDIELKEVQNRIIRFAGESAVCFQLYGRIEGVFAARRNRPEVWCASSQESDREASGLSAIKPDCDGTD